MSVGWASRLLESDDRLLMRDTPESESGRGPWRDDPINWRLADRICRLIVLSCYLTVSSSSARDCTHLPSATRQRARLAGAASKWLTMAEPTPVPIGDDCSVFTANDPMKRRGPAVNSIMTRAARASSPQSLEQLEGDSGTAASVRLVDGLGRSLGQRGLCGTRAPKMVVPTTRKRAHTPIHGNEASGASWATMKAEKTRESMQMEAPTAQLRPALRPSPRLKPDLTAGETRQTARTMHPRTKRHPSKHRATVVMRAMCATKGREWLQG
jgi:hypothetical protein